MATQGYDFVFGAEIVNTPDDPLYYHMAEDKDDPDYVASRLRLSGGGQRAADVRARRQDTTAAMDSFTDRFATTMSSAMAKASTSAGGASHSTTSTSTPLRTPAETSAARAERELHEHLEKEFDGNIRAMWYPLPPDEQRNRQELIEELEAHINGEVWDFGDDEWDPDEHDDDWLSIVPFGSHVTGLDSAASDLDLVVLDHFPPNGVRVHERRERLLPEIYNPYRLAKILRKARYRNVTVVASAAVQLVKFARRVAGRDLSVDLNVNHRFGVYNSRMLRAYIDLYPDMRPMAHYVKRWATNRELKNPSTQSGRPCSMSSYTLNLLVISYLQRLRLLPYAQSRERVRDDTAFLWGTTDERKSAGSEAEIAWHTGYSMPDDWIPESKPNLHQLLLGFFDYYGTFDATKSVVSIHIPSYDRPQPYDAEAAEAGLPPSAYGESRGVPPRFAPPSCHEWPAPFNGNKLIVQDPFIRNRNTMKNVSVEVVDLIQWEMRRAVEWIRGYGHRTAAREADLAQRHTREAFLAAGHGHEAFVGLEEIHTGRVKHYSKAIALHLQESHVDAAADPPTPPLPPLPPQSPSQSLPTAAQTAPVRSVLAPTSGFGGFKRGFLS